MLREEDEPVWKKAFQHLERHAPRPGFEKRFWARVDERPSLQPAWKWLPIGAVLAGLLIGLGAGQYQAVRRIEAVPGPVLSQSLPDGSLAGQFAYRK